MKKEFSREIEDKNPTSVSLNGPDGILPQVQETAIKLHKNLEFQHMF